MHVYSCFINNKKKNLDVFNIRNIIMFRDETDRRPRILFISETLNFGTKRSKCLHGYTYLSVIIKLGIIASQYSLEIKLLL